MEAFSSLLALRVDNSPVTDEFPSQRPVTRSFCCFHPWINDWVNNREVGDLRHHRTHRNDVLGSDWYTTEDIWNIWKARSKHLCLICWFGGNGSAPTTSKYHDFNATLKSSAMDEKGYLQCPNIKIHSVIYNIQECHSTIPCLKFPQFPGYLSSHCESIVILYVFNNLQLESRKCQDTAPWVIPFGHVVLALKLLNISRYANYKSLKHTQVS